MQQKGPWVSMRQEIGHAFVSQSSPSSHLLVQEHYRQSWRDACGGYCAESKSSRRMSAIGPSGTISMLV